MITFISEYLFAFLTMGLTAAGAVFLRIAAQIYADKQEEQRRN